MPRLLELYTRTAQIDKIKYGVASSEKIRKEQLVLSLCSPMEFIPDPRTVIEDDVDRQRFERDAEERMRRAEEAK